METEYVDGALAFVLRGRIDSVNTAETEIAIRNELSFYNDLDIAFDAKNLEYISSAGLRIFLKLKKDFKRPVRIFNVSDEIFDILSVTGFTEILEVERTMRRITVKGCKKVSSALNGEILGLSEDEIIKIYGKNVPLSEIKQERSYAQTALIAGIPTLIPYDVVSCEYGYGIVFEKAGAHSLADAIMHDMANINRYAKMFGQLMREIHSIDIPEGKLPNIKDRYKQWLKQLEDLDDIYSKTFVTLAETIQDTSTYVNGDISLNNVLVKDGELLLIDMAGSARGHSLFDLQSIFGSLVAIEKKDPGYCKRTFGLSSDICMEFWRLFFREYMRGRERDIDKTNTLLLKSFVLKEKILDQLEKKYRLSSRTA